MLRGIATRVPRRAALAKSGANTTVRLLSATAVRRMPSLPPVNPPVSTALPSDSFQLLPESQKAGAAEDALYEQQIKDVEAWWASPRYEGIKRPYTAADVVSKRGSQMQNYPSSVMARKLFNLIKERESKGEPIHTSTSGFPLPSAIKVPTCKSHSGLTRSLSFTQWAPSTRSR